METSKVHLSPAELELFCNAEIILTKNRVIIKIILLLEDLQSKMLLEADANEIFSASPKISKGENYEGLPYVILDYPRKAEEKNILFIRSMFWWGNFFSTTLHLSGAYKAVHSEKLAASLGQLSQQNYFIGIHPDPWIHHFKEDNYKRIAILSTDEFNTILRRQEHVKIAAYWPLSEFDVAAKNLYESWRYLINLVS